MGYYEIFTILLSFFLFYFSFHFHNKNKIPTNWPLVGMLPALLKNYHRFNDYFLEVIEKTQLTFFFKGPWFTNMHAIATVDPTNVHYVMSKNFGNYPKGTKHKEILDVFGDGIFNTDYDLWQYHRKMAQSFMHNSHFYDFLVKKTWEKVESGLIPVLDQVSKDGSEVDLQDVFERFAFDTICTIIMDDDPMSLSVDFPHFPFSKALNDVQEVIMYRLAVPTCIWKFQSWLGIGLEKKYKKAWETLDTFIYKCIARKRKVMSKSGATKAMEDDMCADLLTLYMDENADTTTGKSDDKFLRDTVLNYLVAGRDTTSTALSWLFYLLSQNPQVISKIKEELDVIIIQAKDDNDEKGRHSMSRNFEKLSDKLIYLHGALCEALRLYPPVVVEAKCPIKTDILPSGHKVNPNTQIVVNLYAMARMKSIWGDDCYEFKPERWISKNGKIKHEPSYKFLSFNAGPRTCVGKNMAFIQMKAVAVTIIQNYHIQPVEGHQIVPDLSIILRMKHGFKVKVLPY